MAHYEDPSVHRPAAWLVAYFARNRPVVDADRSHVRFQYLVAATLSGEECGRVGLRNIVQDLSAETSSLIDELDWD